MRRREPVALGFPPCSGGGEGVGRSAAPRLGRREEEEEEGVEEGKPEGERLGGDSRGIPRPPARPPLPRASRNLRLG